MYPFNILYKIEPIVQIPNNIRSAITILYLLKPMTIIITFTIKIDTKKLPKMSNALNHPSLDHIKN